MTLTESNESSETSVALSKRNYLTYKDKCKTRRSNIKLVECIYNQHSLSDNGSTNQSYIQRSSCATKSILKDNGKIRITQNKWSSGETLRNNRRAKKRAEKEQLAELLIKHVEITEKLNRNLEKDNTYTMRECLDKLDNIPNISTVGILAIQEALKDNYNRIIFMKWEGVILEAWINEFVANHPRYHASSAWR